ncbi:competence/damage-inducible protein A [Loktanella salsilacus]|jgi:molybdenum cofactor synthesis domain-containing protein|uniref:competence/damage-inducible protein A n=1 Tax=Loktanella salsilacus TaxID=195913 RepID=UPI0020B7EED1|nr:molybdopterin-binding protein [Loktanella salsilacus]UTH43818.1 competence/damage-inducible protein A [Loktanella salsilacus]
MSNPTAAMLVIGDEILSGRTRDSNTNYLAKALTDVGIDLKEARVVSDDQPAIVAAVQALSDAYDHVFTSGGIGPTHDDITADAIGAAFGAHVGVRDDARALLQAHYDRAGTTLNEARLRMARIPDGAALIDNPVSTAPGFTIKNVNVMAGVPSVFEAMVASVISKLAHGTPLLSENWRIMRGEGDVAAPLAQIAADHPDLSLGSYPFQKDGAYGTNIVIRGTDQTRVAAAMAQLQALFPA